MTTAKPNQRGSSHNLMHKETIVSYLFLLPALLFFIGFVLLPMGLGLYTSFLTTL